MNDIAVIQLTNGGFTIVDVDWFHQLNQFNWQRKPSGHIYRCTSEGGVVRTVTMHRVINNTPEDVETDHKNCCRFDNRRVNLRNATPTQQRRNSSKRNSATSNFKGVSWNKGAWVAFIGHNHESLYLGRFRDEKDAAVAYNQKAKELFGEFAQVNTVN